MKYLFPALFLSVFLIACNKQLKYDTSTRIHGILFNPLTGKPESDTYVTLMRSVSIVGRTPSFAAYKTKTTDSLGGFDFGELELDGKGYFYWFYQYGKDLKIDQYKDNNFCLLNIVPSINSIEFKTDSVSTQSCLDTIQISIFSVNDSVFNDTHLPQIVNFKEAYCNINNSIFKVEVNGYTKLYNHFKMGDFRIKIIRKINGIISVENKTVFINKNEDKVIYLDF